jgi:preprotein translocase subunit SecF
MADMFFGTSNLSMIGLQLLFATVVGALSSWAVTFAMGFKSENKPVKNK